LGVLFYFHFQPGKTGGILKYYRVYCPPAKAFCRFKPPSAGNQNIFSAYDNGADLAAALQAFRQNIYVSHVFSYSFSDYDVVYWYLHGISP
jgi:hypothetical protein